MTRITVAEAETPEGMPESALVRLVLHSLQGVGAAIDEMERLSELFCTIPADRTLRGVPKWWHGSCGSNALAKLLLSFCHSGRIFSFVSKFVHLLLYSPVNGGHHIQTNPQNQVGTETTEIQLTHSLVNQAFAVALKSVLDGYVCALSTLRASVNLRRRGNCNNYTVQGMCDLGSSTGLEHPEPTLLEVELHTRELRNQLESLGNVCCQGNEDILMQLSSSGSMLDSSIDLVLKNFPRGSGLLTYLYVLLQYTDPTHYNLLKKLFLCSFEPYIAFIKSWIYRGKVYDLHKEFIVEIVGMQVLNERDNESNDRWFPSVVERSDVCLPCFLADMHDPLLRTGQQLQILIKLLDLCSYSVKGDFSYRIYSGANEFVSFEDILPCWSPFWSNSVSCLPSLAFNWEDIRKIVTEKEIMYKMLLEKLEIFFAALHARSRDRKHLANDHNFGFAFTGNNMASLTFINELNPLFLTIDDGVHEATSQRHSSISSTSVQSTYGTDIAQSSESSSLGSSEEDSEYGDGDGARVSDDTIDPSVLHISSLMGVHGDRCNLQKPCELDNKLHSVSKFDEGLAKEAPGHFLDAHVEDEQIDSFHSSQAVHLRKMEIFQKVDDISGSWPLGDLLSNPFRTEGIDVVQKHSNLDFDLPVACKRKSTWNLEDFEFNQIYIPEDLQSSGKSLTNCLDSAYSSSKEHNQPWNYVHRCNLSMNPMLSKATRFSLLHNRVLEDVAPACRAFPYFNFSFVEDPSKAFLERSVIVSHRSQNERKIHMISTGARDAEVDGHSHEDIKVSEVVQPETDLLTSTNDFLGCLSDKGFSASEGGAKWAETLHYSTEKDANSNNLMSASGSSEIPLDVIINRCVKQDILIQYNYVSCFTIRLLEEEFGLCEHLLALRRYHFMELSDWADIFAISLWKSKWDGSDRSQQMVHIQRLLDQALQKSSCERDPYRHRLYIKYVDRENIQFSATAIGGFNFTQLGYKVDWPLNVVLNHEALKTYSDIFGFLMQIRIALFTLSDVWQALKAFMLGNNLNVAYSRSSSLSFSTFLKLRLQVNHFVTTLHQYVQSQLSDVSWCKFLISLKHQVKDVLDLESVHRSYLSDALHVCFLSVETQPISDVLKDILQCALDLRSCLSSTVTSTCSVGHGHSTDTTVLINLSLVLCIKASFEKSLNNLYLCFLKSPKSAESGLSRFWRYLDYNGYYSHTISRDLQNL